MLGLIVLGMVLLVTIVVAVLAYLIDRGEARLENEADRQRLEVSSAACRQPPADRDFH